MWLFFSSVVSLAMVWMWCGNLTILISRKVEQYDDNWKVNPGEEWIPRAAGLFGLVVICIAFCVLTVKMADGELKVRSGIDSPCPCGSGIRFRNCCGRGMHGRE